MMLSHAVVKAPKSSRITPVLDSFHWPATNERIECQLQPLHMQISHKPFSLHSRINVSLFAIIHSTRSSLQLLFPCYFDNVFNKDVGNIAAMLVARARTAAAANIIISYSLGGASVHLI